MKNKITDDLFRIAAEEMYQDDSIDKTAFDINMAASTLLGYSAGNAIGKTVGKNKAIKESIKNADIPSLEGDYYSQVENISKNLQIMFTPLSVVYLLKNKGKEVTLNTIETSEMDEKMRSAYNNKDTEFFKNLMINKISMEVQNVEQIFVSKMLDANKKLQVNLEKKASIEDFSLHGDLLDFSSLKKIINENPEGVLAEYFSKVAEESDDITVSLELERPIRNYSDLGTKGFDFFKIAKATKDEMVQDKLLDPKYLKKRVEIGFMADRVTFTVDNIIVGQLHTMAMNEEGFDAFRDKNVSYFKNIFIKETEESTLTKTASEVLTLNDIFYSSTVHPKMYYIALNSKMGKDWLEYDPEVLIKMIENEFELTEPIYSIAIDKVMCIQNVCSSTDCLSNDFIFEKAARAFNNKSISFNEWEYNLSPGELVYALQIIDELTPNNDIFDDLSEKVVAYISKAFVLGECRAIIPSENIISSELESSFFELLNSDINQRWSSLNPQEIVYQRYIQPLSSAVIKGIRAHNQYNSHYIDGLLSRLASKSNITDERVLNLSRQTAIANLGIDLMIEKAEKELKEMRITLNI